MAFSSNMGHRHKWDPACHFTAAYHMSQCEFSLLHMLLTSRCPPFPRTAKPKASVSGTSCIHPGGSQASSRIGASSWTTDTSMVSSGIMKVLRGGPIQEVNLFSSPVSVPAPNQGNPPVAKWQHVQGLSLSPRKVQPAVHFSTDFRLWLSIFSISPSSICSS